MTTSRAAVLATTVLGLVATGCGIDDSTADVIQPPVAAYVPADGWDEQDMSDGDFPEYGDPPIYDAGSFCTNDSCVTARRQFLAGAPPDIDRLEETADRLADVSSGWEVVYRPACRITDGQPSDEQLIDRSGCRWEVDTGDGFTVIDLDLAQGFDDLWSIDVEGRIDDYWRRVQASPSLAFQRQTSAADLLEVGDRAHAPPNWGASRSRSSSTTIAGDPANCVQRHCLRVIRSWVPVDQLNATQVNDVAASTGLEVTQRADSCEVDPDQERPHVACTATGVGDGVQVVVEVTGYPATGGHTVTLEVTPD